MDTTVNVDMLVASLAIISTFNMFSTSVAQHRFHMKTTFSETFRLVRKYVVRTTPLLFGGDS